MRTKEVAASFMADCTLRGLSTRTLQGYKSHLERLIEISPQFPPKPEIVQQFLADVKGVHNADAHYRTFRAVSNYAHKRFQTPNFMRSVTRPRIPKLIMPTISNMELNLLAWAVESIPPRDKAIICLFIDTAIRKGEAVNLKRKDIQEDRIIIHGKTGYRVAPISKITRDLLLSLPIHEDGYVFHGTFRYKNHRLNSTGFYKVVRKCLRSIGYEGKQFGPQTLRRSFGVFHLRDGGDLKSLSLILGHSNITTTANYYTPLLTEDVIQIHHKHTPIKVFENANR
jgi:integrase